MILLKAKEISKIIHQSLASLEQFKSNFLVP